MKGLIIGQSGEGKTYLWKALKRRMGDRGIDINAEEMRKEATDWDF